MPFIKMEDRRRFQNILNAFYDCNKFRPITEGECTYILYCFIVHLFKNNPCYKTINMISGSLHDALREFERNYVNNYEEEKKKTNGDI